MAGIISQFAPRAPDPDNGRINRRYMTSLAAAPGVLNWGQPAEAQAQGTARIARQWGLPVDLRPPTATKTRPRLTGRPDDTQAGAADSGRSVIQSPAVGVPGAVDELTYVAPGRLFSFKVGTS